MTAIKVRNRNNERRHLAEDERLLLLEQDMDQLDVLIQELKAEVKRTNGIMVKLLIAVVTGILIYTAQLILDIAASRVAGM